MRLLKLFDSFQEDLSEGENLLIMLIDDDGNEHDRYGTWEEGYGIFDEEGTKYPAGVKSDGTIIVDSSLDDGALKLNQSDQVDRSWQLGSDYKNLDTGLEFVPGLEHCLKPGFNYFKDKKIMEKYDLNKLSDNELLNIKNELITKLDKLEEFILNRVSYDLKTNKIVFKKGFINVDISSIINQLNEEFGEDIIRELNVEALIRKLYQILELKKRSTRRRIKEEFDTYETTIEERLKRQSLSFGDEDHFDKLEGEYSIIPRRRYEGEKYNIQIELMKLQEWVVKNKKRVAIVFEGRDAAGKGSTIKRFTEYLNPKHYRVVALGIPTEEEKNNWLDRYEKQMPNPGEIVFFDRSWYNRAVVEPAMGYCTEDQYNSFMEDVVDWEEKMIRDGLILIKFWFSITKEKQQMRFKFRQNSPLKYWKFSPNDAKVIDKFEVIGEFKNKMFTETSTRITPWVIINSNDKKVGRLNAMRYLLDKISYDKKDPTKCVWYPEVVNVIV